MWHLMFFFFFPISWLHGALEIASAKFKTTTIHYLWLLDFKKVPRKEVAKCKGCALYFVYYYCLSS